MKKTFLALGFAAVMAVSLRAAAIGTAFTYQDQLNDNGTPAPKGLYDLEFTLFDAATAGGTVSSPVPVNALLVTQLDSLPCNWILALGYQWALCGRAERNQSLYRGNDRNDLVFQSPVMIQSQ